MNSISRSLDFRHQETGIVRCRIDIASTKELFHFHVLVFGKTLEAIEGALEEPEGVFRGIRAVSWRAEEIMFSVWKSILT